MLNNLISSRTETDNQIITHSLNNNILETKIVSLQKENSPLRLKIQNNQDTIKNLLKSNTTLQESISTNFILPTQNKTDFTESHHQTQNNSIIRGKNVGSTRKGK